MQGESLPESVVQKSSDSERDKTAKEFLSDPDLQSYLDNIDYESLHGMLLDIARKTDLEIDSINLPPKEDVRAVKNFKTFFGTMLASYGPMDNSILFYKHKVNRTAKSRNFDKQALVTYIISHELVHALTKHEVQTDATEIGGPGEYHIKNGYERSDGTIDENLKEHAKATYSLFEEGLTEKLGREVYLRYVASHPDQFNSHAPEVMKIHTNSVKFVEGLIKLIAHHSGFEEDMVWDALVRDKLEARGFDDPELQDLMAEIDPELLSKIANVKHPDNFRKLTKNLDQPNKTSWVNRFTAWLQRKNN